MSVFKSWVEIKEYHTLSRPAIDEKSKGFGGSPAPGIDGMADAVPDWASEELDPEEVFFADGSVFSSE